MYLCLGHLSNLDRSVAVLDLGGGSLEVTYRPFNNSEIPINTKYLLENYSIMGNAEKLYTHRYIQIEV